MVAGDDGSIYVLETVARTGRRPLVRRFDEFGRELDAVETAERTPSQIRLGPAGPVVLQQPSGQWLPVANDGAPLAPERQRRAGEQRATAARRRRGRRASTSKRGPRPPLSPTVASGAPGASRAKRHSARCSWHNRSESASHSSFALYSGSSAEFVVLILDRHGLARGFCTRHSGLGGDGAARSLPTRRRLSLPARLGHTATAFVDRFDMEVR